MPEVSTQSGSEGKRALFITLSCVGDVIMTTPVLQALHEHFPETVIDIVADKRSSILLSSCPYLGNIYHKEKKRFLRGAPHLLKDLRKINYEAVVDLRTDGLAYLLKARSRYTKWHKQPYGPHAVEDLMGVIKRLHGSRPLPPTTIWHDTIHEEYASKSLAALPAGRWLAMAPAVAAESKRWSQEKFIALANALSDLFSGVVLVGSAAESATTAAVASRLSLPCVDLAGADLLQTAAAFRQMAMFVGSDSGLGHLASASGVPTLTFFGEDSAQRCLPWGGSASWLKGRDNSVSNIEVKDAEMKIREAMSV